MERIHNVKGWTQQHLSSCIQNTDEVFVDVDSDYEYVPNPMKAYSGSNNEIPYSCDEGKTASARTLHDQLNYNSDSEQEGTEDMELAYGVKGRKTRQLCPAYVKTVEA